jgi:hypothetical protein
MWTSYFHQNSFHYFDDYLMTKLTLRYGNQWYGMLQLTTTHNFDNESTVLKVKRLERRDKCKQAHIANIFGQWEYIKANHYSKQWFFGMENFCYLKIRKNGENIYNCKSIIFGAKVSHLLKSRNWNSKFKKKGEKKIPNGANYRLFKSIFLKKTTHRYGHTSRWRLDRHKHL